MHVSINVAAQRAAISRTVIPGLLSWANYLLQGPPDIIPGYPFLLQTDILFPSRFEGGQPAAKNLRCAVEDWRGGPLGGPCLYPEFRPSCPCRVHRNPVSSPRLNARSTRITGAFRRRHWCACPSRCNNTDGRSAPRVQADTIDGATRINS